MAIMLNHYFPHNTATLKQNHKELKINAPQARAKGQPT
jgi:hypothetical protein